MATIVFVLSPQKSRSVTSVWAISLNLELGPRLGLSCRSPPVRHYLSLLHPCLKSHHQMYGFGEPEVSLAAVCYNFLFCTGGKGGPERSNEFPNMTQLLQSCQAWISIFLQSLELVPLVRRKTSQ